LLDSVVKVGTFNTGYSKNEGKDFLSDLIRIVDEVFKSEEVDWQSFIRLDQSVVRIDLQAALTACLSHFHPVFIEVSPGLDVLLYEPVPLILELFPQVVLSVLVVSASQMKVEL